MADKAPQYPQIPDPTDTVSPGGLAYYLSFTAKRVTEFLYRLSQRANATLPEDGSERMTGPLPLATFTTGSLPSATAYYDSLVFDATTNAPKYSDGSSWLAFGSGTGSGGSLELTDGTHDLTGVTKITVSNMTVGGSATASTLNLSDTGIVAATYGSSSVVPVITFDAKGRATTASTASISGSTPFATTPTIVQSAKVLIQPGNPPSGTLTLSSTPTIGNLLMFILDVPDAAGSVYDLNSWTVPSGVRLYKYPLLSIADTISHAPVIMGRTVQSGDGKSWSFTFTNILNSPGGASSLVAALEIANAGGILVDNYKNPNITSAEMSVNPLVTYVSGVSSISRNALGVIMSSVSYDASSGTQSATISDTNGSWSTLLSDLDNTNLDYRYVFTRSGIGNCDIIINWSNLRSSSPQQYPDNTTIVIEARP